MLLLVWYLVPHMVVYLYPIPKPHLYFLKLSLKSIITLPLSLSAPFIVPIALLFAKWEDDKLPKYFSWYDNDVSLNGDRVEDWGLDNRNNAYYAKAPPRSFWARYIWVGWRNRCSKLLNYTYKDGEFASRIVLGDPLTSRSHEGYKFVYTSNVAQLMIVKNLGNNLCFRFNWGCKFFDKLVTPETCISGSILSYEV